MEENKDFVSIDENNASEQELNTISLPTWSLEPPFETIERSE